MALRAFIGSRLEQDHVGEAAGSLLRVVQSADSLPPGESGRDDYVLDLPRTADPDIDPGTASEGLVVATESLSRGVLIAVPVTVTGVPPGLRGCSPVKPGCRRTA